MNTFPKDQGTLNYVIDTNSFPMAWFKDQTWMKFRDEIRAAMEKMEGLGIFKFKQAMEPKDWATADITVRFATMDGIPDDPHVVDQYGKCHVSTKTGKRTAVISLDVDQKWGHTWWQVNNPFNDSVHFRSVLMHELMHALGWTEHTSPDVRDYSIMDVSNAGGYSKGIPNYDRWKIRKLYGLA